MPFPRRYERYERLLALDEHALDVTLQSLSLTRRTLSLPPRKRKHNAHATVFPPIGKHENPACPTTTAKLAPHQPPDMSDAVVRAIIAAAVRDRHRRAGNIIENGTAHVNNQNARTRVTTTAPPRKLFTKPREQAALTTNPTEEDQKSQRTEFRTARSRLPTKRRGMQPTQQRGQTHLQKRLCTGNGSANAGNAQPARDGEKEIPEVPNVDPRLVENIMSEMLENSPNVDWDDIAGLQFAKNCVMEAVVWPMLRPDIFTGLRGPPKGLLLFGPPGTGKTMIGRAIASKSGARFFNISASSLVSKWAGEGEKTVRALFAVARVFQPSVVFIDEIDSLLTSRSEGEQEFTRRIKTEFLVQMDGAGTSRDDRVLVVGATNRPQELDEAARRRLVKRLYIPLPDLVARVCLTKRLLEKQVNELSEDDIEKVANVTKGYSGSDMYALCAEAALAPVRELGNAICDVDVSSVRPVRKDDFLKAARMVRASVGDKDLAGYREWNERFGSFPSGEGETERGDGNEAGADGAVGSLA